MGVALQDLGKLDEALDAYNKALTLKPSYPLAYHNIGVVLNEQGKSDDAIKGFNKALALEARLC